MKYKIWDRINKRYDENKHINQDEKMICCLKDVDGGAVPFDKDDFEVQWVKFPGDDLVDPRIWEEHKRKEDIKRLASGLIKSLSELRGIIINEQNKLIDIIEE